MQLAKVAMLLALIFTSSAWGWGWPKDYKPVAYDDAFRNAASNGKPVAVYYSLSYCPYCKLLEGLFRANDVFEVWAGNINVVSIDPGSELTSEKLDQIRAEWGQIVTPTLVFFTASGKYVCIHRGGFNNSDEAVSFANELFPKLVNKNASKKRRSCGSVIQAKKAASTTEKGTYIH
jgi:thioredoxin-related protein